MKDRIRMVRDNACLSQTKFGEKIGISRDTVANIESGRIEIKDIFIKSICKEFNINEDWLRNGKGEMSSVPTDDYTRIAVEIDKNDKKARQAIIDYWNLSEQDKELFWKFMDRFVNKNGEG